MERLGLLKLIGLTTLWLVIAVGGIKLFECLNRRRRK
jgi:hypothetical protein